MVKVFNNMIQGKGKVIAIAIALVVTGFSALLVMLTAINFSMKIAIIAVVVAAVIFTYLGLSIPSFIKKFRAKKNDVSANNKKQPDVSGDDMDPGYGTGDEEIEEEARENTVISTKEQEETALQVQEDLANARERERMERGWLGGSINALGEPINSEPSMDLCSQLPSKPVNKIPEVVMLSLPEHMDLYGNPLPDQVIYTENSHLVFESQKPKQDSYVPMKSLPDNMNGFYETIPNTKEDPRNTQHVANHMPSMESPPDNMDIFGNKLPYSPSTHVNMNSSPEQCAQKKLFATEWLLKNEPWVLKQCPVKMPATTEDILNQRG